MARRHVRITGARELEAVLKKLPGKVRGKVLRSALMSGARVVRKAARERAPADSGALRESIAARRDKAGERGASVAAKVGPTRKGFYGMFLEFGTSKLSARPWLRPAFEETKGEALARIGKTLARAIEREAVKLAGPFRNSGLGRRRRRR